MIPELSPALFSNKLNYLAHRKVRKTGNGSLMRRGKKR